MNSTAIRTVRTKLNDGSVSMKEIVEEKINLIRNENERLNAFTRVYPEEALKQAETIQNKIKQGRAGKLAGAVIGIKEAIVEKGRKATAGSAMLSNFESVYNSTAVERLIREDAILIGRLNMDEFAMGSSNENSAHGPARNPVNPEYVPGGSSGGSAAAVAAGMCHTALGSDTGGSIRQPASLCGVVGLKPTYGRVSRYGLIAYASSFDCIGPFANNTEDAALMLEVLAGRDPQDSTSSSQSVENYTESILKPVKGLKIGIPQEYFGEGLDQEIGSRIMDQLKQLEKEGAELVPVNLPHTEYAVATYYILATAEASSNLARYDGIRYGHRADSQKLKAELAEEKKAVQEANGDPAALDSALIRLYKQSRTEGFGTEVKRRIMLGTYVLSAGYYDAYYGKAQRIRRLIQQDFNDAFKKADLLAGPTSPTTAFKLGSKTDDPLQMYLSDIYTISANLAGVPGISVPVGLHSNGLPVGMQFMAPHFRESNLFRASAAIERLQQ